MFSWKPSASPPQAEKVRSIWGFLGTFRARRWKRPVNPGQTEILGHKCYPDVASIPGAVDIVDVFRSLEHVPAVVDDALRAGARALWLQLGTDHPEAAQRAAAGGMEVVREQCIMVVHRVLGVAKK